MLNHLACSCCLPAGSLTCQPADAAPLRLSRRRVLAGVAASAGLALSSPRNALAQAPAAAPRNIVDVHHHVTPPAYREELVKRGINDRLLLNWSVQKSLADMDKGGVATSILSLAPPGIWFDDPATARILSRKCNDYCAQLAKDHPGRFGVFAALPLPDVEGSLKEIEYALDTLHADGFALFTSYGDKYLGDSAFDPVMEALNARKAVVYTHPRIPNCCGNVVPAVQLGIVEFQTDTSRAIASVIATGVASRYPDIKWIWSHGGGTMPFLYGRFIRMVNLRPAIAPNVPKGVAYELSKFFYDVAQVAYRPSLAALALAVPQTQVVFGTDFPYRSSADHVAGLTEFYTDHAKLAMVLRQNAETLIPRLKS